MKSGSAYFFVGSTNPVKINAVTLATSAVWLDAAILGFEVPSGVPDQPVSDEQTKLGAQNRATTALKLGLAQIAPTKKSHHSYSTLQSSPPRTALGIGLEGGVFTNSEGELWSTVWVSVVDQSGQHWDANGARFKVPQIIAERIVQGEEMGPVLSDLFGGADIRRQNGAIGIVTNNFVTRTEEYSAICKLALGLWYGKDWETILLTQ